MHVSNRFVIRCYIQIVIRMLKICYSITSLWQNQVSFTKSPFLFILLEFSVPRSLFRSPRLLGPLFAVYSGPKSTDYNHHFKYECRNGECFHWPYFFAHIRQRKLFSFSIATTKNHQGDHKMFLQELIEKILPIKNKIKA